MGARHQDRLAVNDQQLRWLQTGFRLVYFKTFIIRRYNIAQWVLQVMFSSACSFIACWFYLSFTTFFSLHGHPQVCRILHVFIFTCLRVLLFCFFFTWSHCTIFICGVGKVVIWGIIIICYLCYFWYCFIYIYIYIFCLCFVLVLFSFVQYSFNNTCNTHWTVQCSRMLKYSITI
jgi:hypothetical protein